MPITVNSNTTATTASFNLSHANTALRKSLSRLSSGKRIVSPADDAGGLAVAYKLNSKLSRTEAVRHNVQNGLSYLQVQDGAMTTVAKVVDRMSELRTMASDVQHQCYRFVLCHSLGSSIHEKKWRSSYHQHCIY